jgi:hypothetical protein
VPYLLHYCFPLSNTSMMSHRPNNAEAKSSSSWAIHYLLAYLYPCSFQLTFPFWLPIFAQLVGALLRMTWTPLLLRANANSVCRHILVWSFRIINLAYVYYWFTSVLLLYHILSLLSTIHVHSYSKRINSINTYIFNLDIKMLNLVLCWCEYRCVFTY